jgi:hypothetical protein
MQLLRLMAQEFSLAMLQLRQTLLSRLLAGLWQTLRQALRQMRLSLLMLCVCVPLMLPCLAMQRLLLLVVLLLMALHRLNVTRK